MKGTFHVDSGFLLKNNFLYLYRSNARSIAYHAYTQSPSVPGPFRYECAKPCNFHGMPVEVPRSTLGFGFTSNTLARNNFAVAKRQTTGSSNTAVPSQPPKPLMWTCQPQARGRLKSLVMMFCKSSQSKTCGRKWQRLMFRIGSRD